MNVEDVLTGEPVCDLGLEELQECWGVDGRALRGGWLHARLGGGGETGDERM